LIFYSSHTHPPLHPLPTRRSSDLLRPTLTPLGIMVRNATTGFETQLDAALLKGMPPNAFAGLLEGLTHIERSARAYAAPPPPPRSEEHTSELQSRENLVCRLVLEK